MPMIIALALMSVLVSASAGLGQTTPPLNFGNNYFVTGDYVVAGVGLRGLGDATGFATGTIKMPDPNTVPSTGVPAGADVVAAFLYWETVESSQTIFAGQQGFFRDYPITGVVLGNPNAPVSWSSGGCSGSSQGSKTMRAYRANVLSLLPVDVNGNLQPNTSYKVKLADSGSNGGGAPLTLGASLVIVYRVISPDFPLKSVVIYDGAYAPANGSSTMTQSLQGFYQAAASPVAKLTHIVGNGQDNKYEDVYMNSVHLPSLYGTLPPFPGYYNSNGTTFDGSWDNPTWIVNNYTTPAVHANDPSATTSVVPATSNSGCVSWGTIILSTTVQNSDNDGILDVWKANQGYCDASIYEGMCSKTDSSWVALPGATPGKKDLFVQMDYMCSSVNPADGSCDTNGTSFLPGSQALTMMTNAFAPKGINLHLFPTYAIQEQACHDDLNASPPVVCPAPNQPGVVGWKAGFSYLKNQPLNINPATGNTYTETECQQNPTTCIRRFQHGRKDSYHYVLFGDALGTSNWSLLSQTLQSAVASGNTVTFTTSTPHGLVASKTPDTGNDRVTVSGAISNLSLNGTYLVQSTPSDSSFTIQIANAVNTTTPYTLLTDPALSVASGQTRSGSGMSDIGGEDSLITLGLWGADGQTVNVQAGTFMHELGHSLGLTHGGYYYAPGTYIATGEANCKPNFQSVMNYLFQVDLLDNGALDYSEQRLSALNEQTLSEVPGVTTNPIGSALAYLTTQWYALSPPGGVGTAASHYCDGRPFTQGTNPEMYRVGGAANPISPAWTNNQDINFNGNTDTSLQGYNDWANLDLRQIGATGSLSTESPGQFNGGQFNGGQFNGGQFNGGQFNGGQFNGGQFNAGQFNGGQFNGGQFNGGQFNGGQFNGGVGDFTHEAANSATRPPRNLTATLTPIPRYIQLNWLPPTFGQIGYYHVYRSTNGATAVQIITPDPVTSLTFTDKNVTCGPTYTYFVTAVLEGTTQESVASNSVSLSDCAPPYNFTGFYSPLTTADPPNGGSFSGTFNLGKSVTTKWTLQDSSGNLVTNLNANTLYVTGAYPVSSSGAACSTAQAPLISSYNGVLPANVITLYSPTAGAKGNSTFRFSSNQFVFNWDTTGLQTGCWVLELDLDSGQVERTSLRLR